MSLILPPLPYDPADRLEQGGILIGHGRHVTGVTGVGKGDVRSESHFELRGEHHGAALMDHGGNYLGVWHSHPDQITPEPSPQDVSAWKMAAEEEGRELIFPIITPHDTRVWIMWPNGAYEEVTEWTPATQLKMTSR